MAARAAEVWGVDHRASQIDMARATAAALGIKNVRFETGDVRDPDLFKDIGKFDLAIAWGFLHRITDIFALFYALEPITNAISLEWRTPVLPMMSELSLAYHPTSAATLDPMNTGRKADLNDLGTVTDKDKVEGNSAFWEPTPGAVKAILSRLGYAHHTLLGYDEGLESQDEVMRHWRAHESAVAAGREKATRVPEARVHMLFEKAEGSIRIAPQSVARTRIPAWDHALVEHMKKADQAASRPAPVRTASSIASRLRRKIKSLLGQPKATKSPDKGARKRRRAEFHYDKEAVVANILAQADSVWADASSGDSRSGPSSNGDIQIAEIDPTKLTVVTYHSAQLARFALANKALPRAVFRDDKYFYKVWRHDYDHFRRVKVGKRHVKAAAIGEDGIERLWGFHVGLFDQEVCPAYVGGIYNGTRLVGYRTLIGQPVERLHSWHPGHAAFMRAIARNTARSGFVHPDFKLRNLIRLDDGRLSLIDFDGSLATLFRFSPQADIELGALRPFVIESYRRLLNRFLNPSVTDPAILRMRENARSLPAKLAASLQGTELAAGRH